MFKSPLGMKDILPEEGFYWLDIEQKARKVFSCFGYLPIRTPILEDIRLFHRSLGNQTDIVKKQMFSVKRQSEEYVLRPEATAAIVRAYLENSLDKTKGFIKLYYIGPMFRAERPQKGRLREFNHIGAEALASKSPYLDSEIIVLADRILKELGISGYNIRLNTMGCREDKDKFKAIVDGQLKKNKKHLCEDCKERYSRNIFRIIDCKKEGCRKIVSGLDIDYKDYLCAGCSEHFKVVRENLDALGVKYGCFLTLVRGLDYYTSTVFEISHPDLGAQDAIGAGGRYDNLITELGGPDFGAVGFALGVERLLLAAPQVSVVGNHGVLDVFVVTLGREAKKEGFILLDKLRQEHLSADMDFEDKPIKAQMRSANNSKARFTIIIGDDELKKQSLTLKDMRSGIQEEIGAKDFAGELKKRLT